MFRLISQKLRRFSRDTRGSTSIELILFTPLLFMMLAAAFVFYDAYRQKAINTNAAYTISDALSRETEAIDGAYLDGLHQLLEFLTQDNAQVGMRVTVVRYDGYEAKYYADWSETRGPLYPLTDRDLNTSLMGNLPTLLHNERVIVVETSSTYTPVVEIAGLAQQELYNFAFTRPRFAPKLELLVAGL